MPSADFLANSGALPADFAASATVTLSLVSTTGVKTVEWAIRGKARSGHSTPTFTPSGSPSGATAQITLGAQAGQGYLIEARINGGVDEAGNEIAAYTVRETLFVPYASGARPLIYSEELETDATVGQYERLNAALEGAGASNVVIATGTGSTTGAAAVTLSSYTPTSNGAFYLVACVFGRKTGGTLTGNPNLTFAEVGATGDTITRSAGSWITDGFAPNDRITVSGSVSNNFSNQLITAVSATVLTLDTQDLVAEGPSNNITVTSAERKVFSQIRRAFERTGGGNPAVMTEAVEPPAATVLAGSSTLISTLELNTSGAAIVHTATSPTNTSVSWVSVVQRVQTFW